MVSYPTVPGLTPPLIAATDHHKPAPHLSTVPPPLPPYLPPTPPSSSSCNTAPPACLPRATPQHLLPHYTSPLKHLLPLHTSPPTHYPSLLNPPTQTKLQGREDEQRLLEAGCRTYSTFLVRSGHSHGALGGTGTQLQALNTTVAIPKP